MTQIIIPVELDGWQMNKKYQNNNEFEKILWEWIKEVLGK